MHENKAKEAEAIFNTLLYLIQDADKQGFKGAALHMKIAVMELHPFLMLLGPEKSAQIIKSLKKHDIPPKAS